MCCPAGPGRQSWPSRVDMHQDIEDSLATASMAGGPQSPARSAENLLNGHRSSKPLELGRREDLTDSPQVTVPPPPGVTRIRGRRGLDHRGGSDATLAGHCWGKSF